MAVSALEMWSLAGADRGTRRVALGGFLVVAAKCIVELATGHALFTTMHFGMLGTPIVECHAGGVMGGMLAAWFYESGVPKVARA